MKPACSAVFQKCQLGKCFEGNVGNFSTIIISFCFLQADEKAFDFKPGFMASFLDFLKTDKKQPDLESGHDGDDPESRSSLKGGIRSSSPTSPPLPPTPPQQPPGAFSDAGQGEESDLALSSCSSPCKPLDDELKRNLETLPSFSSDEEDSVSKNQDLQKSISSAISALYDTPHSLAAALASAVFKAQVSPPTPQEPSLSPHLPIVPPLSIESRKEDAVAHTQHETQDKPNTQEENRVVAPLSREETEELRSEQAEEVQSRKTGGEETADGEGKPRDSHNTLQGAKERQREEQEDTVSEMQIMDVLKVEYSEGKNILFSTISLTKSWFAFLHF